MSLITVDLRDRKQLYEQLVDNIKNLILTGELQPDDKLPSVRSLAKELGINPNTIQKAYSELERQGVIMSLQGRGSIILADKKGLRGEQYEKLVEKMRAIAYEMKTAGISEAEFVEAAGLAYRKIGGNTDDKN
ncbi:MAG: GntR family transcriptional regulator [Clostridia bacterium]|nr:GntR family transcriptional regulator [Clostridia bacterium]